MHVCQTTSVMYLVEAEETWAQNGKILGAVNFRLFCYNIVGYLTNRKQI